MDEDASKKLSKWDKPSKEDLFGREPFVDTIVKTIKSSKEGFNLGISARWGEGKSSILEQLKPKLEDLNYKVLTFAPWKYTQDQSSIKRKFIIDIYSQIGEDYDSSELYSAIEREKELTIEEYQKVFMGRLGLFARFTAIAACLFLLILFVAERVLGVDINITQTFLTNLFIPVLAGLLPLVTKITEVTVKQSTPRIESAEQFEKRFEEAIDKIMATEKPPERIVIFVDDLDRCSHVDVEQILTALFTFFNHEKCTYVITADHTVIRRYISQFLKLDDILGEDGNVDVEETRKTRDKEATEYLKKIFQINFILPKTPTDLLEKFVKNLVDDNPIISSKSSYGKEYLIKMILNNFEGNPRKIKHFIRTLVFQLEAVSEKIARLADKESEESKNLTKVKDFPELLAKILIFQDRFPDFYEQIASEPRQLQRYEDGEIAEDSDLQNLLAQEPKFSRSLTRPAPLKTIDPYYFLYFSGSTGFTETKPVDPAEIKPLARSANFEYLTKIISGLTDEPRNTAFEHIKSEFDAQDIQTPEKVNVVRSLIHVGCLIEEPTLRLDKLKGIFSAKEKYSVELASLQSVDFEKVIPLIDDELVKYLFTEVPFTDFGVQLQLLNAFLPIQQEVRKIGMAEEFLQAIAEGIRKGDINSSSYVALVSKLSDENIAESEPVVTSLLETYSLVAGPLKQEIFDTLLAVKDRLSRSQKTALENLVLDIVERGQIGATVSMLGNVPERINKKTFDLSKLVKSISKRVHTCTDSELSQLTNILIHPAFKGELAPKEFDQILSALVEVLDSTDTNKRSYIRGQLPELIGHVENKTKLLDRIIESIQSGPLSESIPTLSTVHGMSDFWSANPNLKKEFATNLKKMARSAKDTAVKDFMRKSADELVPPIVEKSDS